jgi:hypothetical protein
MGAGGELENPVPDPANTFSCNPNCGVSEDEVFQVSVRADQIGVVVGRDVSMELEDGTIVEAPGDGECDLIVLGWGYEFTNLTILDGRVVVYTLPPDDLEGWRPTLVTPLIYEQHKLHECEEWLSVPIWTPTGVQQEYRLLNWHDAVIQGQKARDAEIGGPFDIGVVDGHFLQ